jgi:anti-sigma regulatory factor (Ser/Thr protein kinase)
LELRRGKHAPSAARAEIRRWAAARGLDPARVDVLALLVSEIVTNAVIHAPGEEDALFVLSARAVPGDLVRIELTDPGEGFVPRPRDPARIAGGYGLQIVEESALRWGVEHPDRTLVWFEL